MNASSQNRVLKRADISSVCNSLVLTKESLMCFFRLSVFSISLFLPLGQENGGLGRSYIDRIHIRTHFL